MSGQERPPPVFRFRNVGDEIEFKLKGIGWIITGAPADLRLDGVGPLLEMRCNARQSTRNCGRLLACVYHLDGKTVLAGMHVVMVDKWDDPPPTGLAIPVVDLADGWHAGPCTKCGTHVGYRKSDVLDALRDRTSTKYWIQPFD